MRGVAGRSCQTLYDRGSTQLRYVQVVLVVFPALGRWMTVHSTRAIFGRLGCCTTLTTFPTVPGGTEPFPVSAETKSPRRYSLDGAESTFRPHLHPVSAHCALVLDSAMPGAAGGILPARFLGYLR